MLEVEQRYTFDDFFSPFLRPSDLESKPLVMLVGQYSTGKTTFIEFLLRKAFPGSRIGPEPTTDKFVAVMHGGDERIIPGNALSVDPEKPFSGLNKFGGGFLSKFEASITDSDILENIILVDTPGVLSGEKQRIGRSYDFISVCEWFAEKSDLILLLFDAHKLDISDEFKRSIEALRGNDDKIRIVLNKADTVNPQQLMRVYGALMWSLGKVVQTPEVMRVYISSFWDKEYQNKDNTKLFEAEKRDLLEDLLSLPSNSAIRKVNEIVKRARLLRAHALILSHLKNKMPAIFGKESKQKELIDGLDQEFIEIQRIHKIPLGDFPNVEKYKERLKDKNFSNFPKHSERLFNMLEEILTRDLPLLMNMIKPDKPRETFNPFDPSSEWVISSNDKSVFDNIFYGLKLENGKLPGNVARQVLMDTGIPKNHLRQIWALCDMEKDGTLDNEEFALAMWFVEQVKKGSMKELPQILPNEMIPPSKRN
jgi:GTPase SAR1 family protein